MLKILSISFDTDPNIVKSQFSVTNFRAFKNGNMLYHMILNFIMTEAILFSMIKPGPSILKMLLF